MKKILIVVPSLGPGGAELMALNICRFLDKNKYCCLFVSLNARENSINDIKASNWGIEVVYLNKNKGFDFAIISKLRKIIKDFGPDVIHSHMNALLYAYLAKRKKVKHIHTVHCIPYGKKYYGYPVSLIKYIFSKKNVLPVSISNIQKQEIIRVFKLKNKSIPLIYNGIDISLFDKPIEKDAKYIIDVGSFREIKNQIALIKGFYEISKINDSICLLLIGDGPMKKKCEELVDNLNIKDKVTFTGIVDDVQNYLCKSLIYVSTSKTEANPVTFLEAMAAGLPIISTNVGGVSDILGDGNGILLDDDSPECIKVNVLFLLNNRELYDKISLNNRRTSLKYDIKKCCENYEQIY